jgi:glyoxylase-like metal-dependent hydrolase (beta-lactamase superfamily II)
MDRAVQIAAFIDQQFGENAYVVWCRDQGPCWIIDPGLPPSVQQIQTHVEQHGLIPHALILTHGHLDHIAGVPPIMKAFPTLPVHMADAARIALTDPNENLSAGYGLPIVVGSLDTIDLAPGAELVLDESRWTVLETSGHSPGGRSLHCREAGMVIVGDALFQGSIGRTDFHHSDHAAFIRNIKANLLSLPGETIVYSGHGPTTTIRVEKASNPFLQE